MKSESSLNKKDDQKEMNLNLKIVKTVRMKVKGSDTIGTLTAKINQKEGISEANPKLFFEGKLLPRAQTIAGCGIPNHSTLDLLINSDSTMKIFINFPRNNKIITLEAKDNETVDELKSMIQQKESVLPNTFSLIFNGNLMEDKRSLASIGIKNNSTIHLVFSEKEVISFWVEAWGKEKVKLTVDSAFSVLDVKAIAVSMLGEKVRDSSGLYYHGRRLVDSKTLAYNGVREGSLLKLSVFGGDYSDSDDY